MLICYVEFLLLKKFYFYLFIMKTFSKDWYINAPWGKISMVSCGDPNGRPVLLVHGRNDSVATFIPLLQLLPDHYNYVGFDLPGHGKSDHFPKGLVLTRFLFTVAIDMVVRHLKWKDFVYLAHSFGGELGLFYNAIYPHHISKFILLDIGPAFQNNMGRPLPEYYKKYYLGFYDNYDKYNVDNKIYSKADALNAVMKARNVNKDQAELILSRNLTRIGDDQYRLSWDRRLKIAAPPMSLNKQFLYKLISKNCPPTLFIQASDTKIFHLEGKRDADQLVKDLEGNLHDFYVLKVEGDHDVHLTNPERLSTTVSEFLNNEFVSSKI